MGVRISLLGPLAVAVDGPTGWVDVPITAAKHRALLSALITGVAHAASLEVIAEFLWGDRPPQNARSAIHVHVARLRRVLDGATPGGGAVIVSTTNGYRLDIAETDLDVGKVRALVADADAARDRSDLEAESRFLVAAVSIWRGRPFADVDCDVLGHGEIASLDDLQTSLQERRFGVALELGQHVGIIGEVRAALDSNPFHEGLAAQLMLASYRCGRQAQALAVYRDLHTRLADELGIDPGSRIQHLHGQILRQATDLDYVGGVSEGLADSVPDPPPSCTLPRSRVVLHGRENELAELTDSLRTPQPPLIVLSGPRGVGKTALAVAAARSCAAHYPDGQWFLQAHRSTESESVQENLFRQLLLHAGLEPAAIPEAADAAHAMVRRTLGGRRLLLIVDGADTADDVAPLLSGAADAAIIVTTPSRLSALTVTHETVSMRLSPLPADASLRLLQAAVSSTGHPGEVLPVVAELAEIAELVDHLPGSLHAIAGRLRGRTARRRADLLAELRAGFPTTAADVVEVSALSRQVLSAMALVPGGRFVPESLGELIAVDAVQINAALDELVDGLAVNEFEDGTTVLARPLLSTMTRSPSSDDDVETLERLASWYLRQPVSPSRTFTGRHRLTMLALARPESGLPPARRLELAAFALTKLDGHGADPDVRALAAHGAAALNELHDHRTEVTANLIRRIQDRPAKTTTWPPDAGRAATRDAADREGLEGHLQRALTLSENVENADRLADLAAYEPDNLSRIGQVLVGLNRLVEASAVLHRALRSARANHNPHGVAAAHLHLSTVCLLDEEFGTARQHAADALRMFGDLDEAPGQARAAVALGDALRAMRRLDEAEPQHVRALGIAEELTDERIAVEATIGLALTYRYLDEPRKALSHATESAQRAADAGLRVLEGRALGVFAVNHLFAGQPQRSRTLLRMAMEVHDETGHELEKQCALRWWPAVAHGQGTGKRSVSAPSDTDWHAGHPRAGRTA